MSANQAIGPFARMAKWGRSIKAMLVSTLEKESKSTSLQVERYQSQPESINPCTSNSNVQAIDESKSRQRD